MTESALTRCIVKAHQAVQDDGVAQRVIKTVHGHGSRFVAAAERTLALAAAGGEVVLHALANFYLGMAYHE